MGHFNGNSDTNNNENHEKIDNNSSTSSSTPDSVISNDFISTPITTSTDQVEIQQFIDSVKNKPIYEKNQKLLDYLLPKIKVCIYIHNIIYTCNWLQPKLLFLLMYYLLGIWI